MTGAKKLPNTMTNLALCEESDRFYNSDIFPKTCNTCHKIYQDRNQFTKETTLLPNGVYSRGTKGKVFEYRNCDCGSTLVCAVESHRDNSPEGSLKRLEFDRQIMFLQSNGISRERAVEMVREKNKKEKS